MMDRREMLKSTAAAASAAAAGVLLPTALAEASDAPRPKVNVRRASERGRANHGWLDARHSFSFASYLDRRWMGYRSLRVINEDRIQAGRGFPMHPHQDMEIITYLLEGALEHKDTLGNGGIIRPGEVQYMSAGTGIRHSEFNPSRRDRTHLLQIWILPDKRRVRPAYGQLTLPVKDRTNTLKLVASKTGRDGSIKIQQDANLLAGIVQPGKKVAWQSPKGRHVWIQVARGDVKANGTMLHAGDGGWTGEHGVLTLEGGRSQAELLLFDLA